MHAVNTRTHYAVNLAAAVNDCLPAINFNLHAKKESHIACSYPGLDVRLLDMVGYEKMSSCGSENLLRASVLNFTSYLGLGRWCGIKDICLGGKDVIFHR